MLLYRKTATKKSGGGHKVEVFLHGKRKINVVRGCEVVRNYSLEKSTENIPVEWSADRIFI